MRIPPRAPVEPTPVEPFWPTTTQEKADHLRALGFEVFPCHGLNEPEALWKKPKVKTSWKNSAENNAATFEEGDLIGVRLPANTVVVDIDNPALFAEQDLDTPETLTLPTRRENGLHYPYRTDGRPVKQTADPKKITGYDTRVGGDGYIIAWHPLDFTPVDQWAMAPEWLYAPKATHANGTGPRATPSDDGPTIGTRDQLLEYVGTLAKKWSFTYNQWLALLITLRADGHLVALDPDRPWTDDDLKHFAEEGVAWQERPWFSVADSGEPDLFEPLRPLDTPYCDVGFPRGVLPAWMDTFAVEVTRAKQTPPGAVEMAMLGGLSMAAQGRIVVEVTKGWRELCVLWIAIAMLSGERKSAISEDVYGPLYRWEQRYNLDHADEYSRSKAHRAFLESAMARAQQQQRRVTSGDNYLSARADGIKAQMDLDAFEQVFPLSIIADDVTPEALAVKMDQNHQNMSINSTEGGVFDNFTGRYNDKVNTDLVLKAYSGDPGKQDRISREPIEFSRPTLTFSVTVQPMVLVDIGANPRLRGNGFLARFLYAVPYPRFGSRAIRPDAPSDEVASAYDDGIRAVADAVEPLRNGDRADTIYLSTDAATRLFEFAGQIEGRLKPGEDLADLGGWAGKLVGQIVRIAGLLHFADHNGRTASAAVSIETLDRALILADYLIAHAKIAFRMMNGRTSSTQAQRVADHMERYRDETGGRFLWGDLRRRLDIEKRDLDSALATLIEHGIIRELTADEVGQKTGRPTRVLVLNPHFSSRTNGG